MPDTNNTVILRVQLDEGKTEEKLKQLVLDLEATTKAQAALRTERKAGTVTDEVFAQQSVKLANQLTLQRAEQRNLTKDLQLYRDANEGVGNSYKGLQAQLSLAQRQFQQLDGSADNSTESAKALGKTIDELRNTLESTDETQSLFVRNLGNYPKGESLQPLIQQLVRLEEIQKSGTLTAQQAAEVDRAIPGFKQQIAQAAAKEGKSYEETTNLVKQYGAAIRPATTALIALEKEQQQVAEGSEAFNQIGFKIAAASKQIQTVPAEVKGVTSTLADLDTTTGAFGGQVANLKQRFAQAKQGIDLAKGGLTGLKGAIAGTGIGLLVLALGALYEYFTKTDEGAEDLAAGLAYLKGLFSVLESAAIGLGKGLVLVFKDPKEAAKEFVDFLESQVVNRVKSFGVLWEAIKTGDATKLVDSAVQFTTGITEATAKTKAFGAEASRAADAAYAISRANDALEDSERNSLKTLAENKNLIDKLVLSAKDRTLSEQQRLANLDRAGALEKANLTTTTALAQERLRIATLENDEAERSGKTSDELRDKVAQAQAAVINLAGESASLQQSIQNRRSSLLQQEAGDEKAAAAKALAAAEKAAEARLKLRRDALALEAILLDRQLKTVQANSDEELNLLQLKLRNGHQAELAVKNLTVAAKKVIDAKYENDSLALTLDFNRRRLQAALQANADLTAAQLAGLQQNGKDAKAEALRLQTEQIEAQRALALAALNENADNTAKIAAINAQAAQQQRQLEYTEATRQLTEYLDNKRQAVELDYANGIIQEGEYQRRLSAITQAGVEAQTVVNEDYQQSNAENQKKGKDNEISQAKQTAAAVKETEAAKQQTREATVQAFQQGADAVITAFGEESAAGQAALAIKKVLAIAEIEIGLEKQLAANAETGAKISALAPPVSTPIGIAYTIATDALAIAAAAASVANVLKMQQGGIAYGPSHNDGGIPLYHRGRPAGIEIEGGEPVLTRGVSQSPLLLTMASAINQLAGGRALVPNFPVPRMALGGVTQPLVLDQLRDSSATIDYERMGEATAKALRKSPPRAIISDVKAGLARDAETERLSNA